MTQLLVSVRSATEAETALRGGASVIDVKEPAHGSLGRASAEVIAEVARVVAGRCPVSAALGELTDWVGPDWVEPASRRSDWVGPASRRSIELSLTFVKWGLSNSQDDWLRQLRATMQRLTDRLPNCRAVAVAYADWRRARAPRPDEVCAFAIDNATGAFLLDTWRKDGSTLLDWLSLDEIERLRQRCRDGGVPMALAGSLGVTEIESLLPLRAEWIAVRGAVCQGRQRGARIDEGKVRQLAALLGKEVV